MNASAEEKPKIVQELHKDLARKYKVHRARIEQIWRSLDRNLRTTVLKDGASDGVVLKNPMDRAMGNVYKIMPEWNLRDITEPGSDYLLDLLRHRATKSLCEQYCQGINGGLGDASFILNSMHINNLRHVEPFKHCFTMFMDGEQYGQSYRATSQARYEETMASLSVAVNAGVCVPQSTGELILERQLYTLQALNIVIEDILNAGSTSKAAEKRPKKPQEAAHAALSKLSIISKPDKLTPQNLLDSALDQRSSLDEYLNLLRTEPAFLAHAVNNWFFSRPELVNDEKGRIMPVVTDKYISITIFDLLHNTVASAANWYYICCILELLKESNDRVHKGIVLQELSNICYLEYSRAQKLFKRHVQSGSGKTYFKRVFGVYDNGTARVTMKGNPELLMRENPQLHYMMRLCQTETNVSKAVDWIKKLDDLHRSHPAERDNMEEREWDSFSDLAVITGFVQSLSTSLPLPPINPRKGQMFTSRLKETAAELDPLKTQIDLADFAVPIDNLEEPGMAEGALNALDQFIIDKTGTKMGFIYQDVINDSIKGVQDYYQQQKERIEQNAKVEPLSIIEVPTSSEERVQQRRQKDKTRPAHSSMYDITLTTATPAQLETVETSQAFKVKQATFEVFSTLFSKSELRGSITWAAFEAAMADLKFSVIPNFGSVFTFVPPLDMVVQKSLKLHRPHKSRIEGHLLLIFASRLKRVYKWGEQTFDVV
ncbi:hypothetical protein VE00_03258 [Pseudogymnoascus sp. WSF 3629]|nr:hypothetical protein VE00_03258 [Pseudogymnoascus sp. WSF 3629]